MTKTNKTNAPEAIKDNIDWVLFSDDQKPIQQGIGYLKRKLVHWTPDGVTKISLAESVSLAKRLYITDDKIDGAESVTPRAYLRWLKQIEKCLVGN